MWSRAWLRHRGGGNAAMHMYAHAHARARSAAGAQARSQPRRRFASLMGNRSPIDKEMDSTVARIMGSDWGDRRKQPVTLVMRVYWVVFAVVIANGVYSYATGKHETYLMEKFQARMDKMLGREDKHKMEAMLEDEDPAQDTSSQQAAEGDQQPLAAADSGNGDLGTPAADEAPASAQPSRPTTSPQSIAQDVRTIAQPSAAASSPVLASRSAPSAVPFFSGRSMGQPQTTKADLEAKLQALRLQQAELRRLIAASTSHSSELDLACQRIDMQKAQLKQAIKQL